MFFCLFFRLPDTVICLIGSFFNTQFCICHFRNLYGGNRGPGAHGGQKGRGILDFPPHQHLRFHNTAMAVAFILLSFFSLPSFGILTTSIACICLYPLYQRYRSGLRSVPGPFLASVTDLYRFLDVLTWKCQENQLVLHKKYGKYVRYGPNMVAISDPDAVQVIYAINNKFVKV